MKRKLTPGELNILCNRSEPVAEMRLVQREKLVPRVGAFRGQFPVPDSFFAPLPDELLKAFGGE
jgi:hypothetical protein